MKLFALSILALSILWIAPCFAQLDYVLAPKDNILIRVPQVEKINARMFQIQADGFVILPSVGRVRAAGVTVTSLERHLTGRLKQSASGQPKVIISVVNFHPVSQGEPDRTPVK
jgi:protein involved in polysaccharide export with SLBB domain